MKAHVGVDSKTKMIHSVVATAANVADSAVLPELLHGEESKVWGDQAYRGQTEVMQEVAPGAQDMTHKQYRYKDRVCFPLATCVIVSAALSLLLWLLRR